MKKISCLLLATRDDFTTDYIAHELHRREINYLRLNRDLMHEYKIALDIQQKKMFIEIAESVFEISEKYLKSIYYRAPTFLRETFSSIKTPEEQLSNSQWMAFYRNLTFFSKARWVNSPNATFSAENKIFQLRTAKEVGFAIPHTVIANYPYSFHDCDDYIIKSLDTALIRHDEKHESFAFTSVISRNELAKSELSIAPVIIQNLLEPKIDYRVTVVGKQVFVVKILKDNRGVVGDWRKFKTNIDFVDCALPPDIKLKCIKIVEILKLNFGAIDLAYSNGIFYFIEINPTGEWAWLKNSVGLKIDEAICNLLTS